MNKFNFDEIVRVIEQPPCCKEPLLGKEGTVVGMSDPDDQNCRDYGVFINEYNLVFAVPEQLLESLGRIDSSQLWRNQH